MISDLKITNKKEFSSNSGMVYFVTLRLYDKQVGTAFGHFFDDNELQFDTIYYGTEENKREKFTHEELKQLSNKILQLPEFRLKNIVNPFTISF